MSDTNFRQVTIPQISHLEGKTNWETWKTKVRMVFKMFPPCLAIVDGTLHKPEPKAGCTEDETKAHEKSLIEYERADNHALLIMSSNMTDEMFMKVRRYETSSEMWTTLCQLFDTVSEDRIFDLFNKFFEDKWLPQDDVIGFVTRSTNNWALLKEEVDKQPKCGEDLILICKILKGLPEVYNSFTAGWRLISKDERNLENLTQKLCTYESNLMKNKHEEALHAQSTERNKHSIKVNTLTPNKNNYNCKKKCAYCDKTSHILPQCRYWIADGRPPKPAKAKFVQNTSTTNSSEGATLIAVSNEVHAAENNNKSDEWYVDNGATNHICTDKNAFSTFETFKSQHGIITANGTQVEAIGKGSIHVQALVDGKWSGRVLTNVWYVPNISKNLFSVLAAQDHKPTSKFESTYNMCIDYREVYMDLNNHQGVGIKELMIFW